MTKVKPGQKVVHQGGAVQVWSQLDVVDEDSLLPVNPKLDLVSASTLVINPPTAYIMLKEFVKLDAGDYVIQNSANSAVGRCVIQEAKGKIQSLLIKSLLCSKKNSVFSIWLQNNQRCEKPPWHWASEIWA